MRVGGQRHFTPRYPQEYSSTPGRKVWVGPRANIMMYENILSQLGQAKLPLSYSDRRTCGVDTLHASNTSKNVI